MSQFSGEKHLVVIGEYPGESRLILHYVGILSLGSKDRIRFIHQTATISQVDKG
jgi:hypothetical protein